jgi:iron complex transport system substrate-binding protein
MQRPTAVPARLRVLACLGLGLTVLGCGGAPAASTTSGSSTSFANPVTISDCTGHQSTFSAPPKRVVTLTPEILEILYWLGVDKTVVAIGSPPTKGSFPTQFEAAAMKLPKLSGNYVPGAYKPVAREVLLAANPDFVLGDFTSNFTAQGATSQQELSASGVNSYLAFSTDCSSALTAAQTGFDLTYRDLTNLGRIFGVEQRAQSLVSEMQAKVSGVRSKLKGAPSPSVFAFEYDEGTDTPYAPSNRQTINAVITLAGARNIFGDVNKAYQKVGWEEIASRNPDVIVVVTYAKPTKADDTADQAKADQFLRTFAPVANVTAVKQQRILHLIYEFGSVGGVRNADAVVQLAAQLYPERVRA